MSNISQTPGNINVSETLQFFIRLNQVFTAVSRRFDHMGSMLGFSDFIILYHLHAAKDGKLRRIDLAEKTGLTASGITRLLPPLEKIGLVERGSDPRDARVSYVLLTPAGKRVFAETIERAEEVAASLLRHTDDKQLGGLSRLLGDIRS